MRLTIYGQPITKKNSQQIIMAGKRPCIIQSKAFRTYSKEWASQIKGMLYKMVLGPVHVKCTYYMATARLPDLTNLLAATHDLLEAFGFIENDRLVKSVDGSRIAGMDKINPRVEISITEYQEN
jgi:Holliday junction resolvase RusA-like endonuclease